MFLSYAHQLWYNAVLHAQFAYGKCYHVLHFVVISQQTTFIFSIFSGMNERTHADRTTKSRTFILHAIRMLACVFVWVCAFYGCSFDTRLRVHWTEHNYIDIRDIHIPTYFILVDIPKLKCISPALFTTVVRMIYNVHMRETATPWQTFSTFDCCCFFFFFSPLIRYELRMQCRVSCFVWSIKFMN